MYYNLRKLNVSNLADFIQYYFFLFNSTNRTNVSEILTHLFWGFLCRLVSARGSLNLTLLRILPLPE